MSCRGDDHVERVLNVGELEQKLRRGAPAALGQDLDGPPHNLDAERSVLGALLLDARQLAGMQLEVGLTGEDFYREQFGLVVEAICQLAQANEPVDQLTASAQLERYGLLERVGGSVDVEQLAGWVPAAGHGLQYAQIVREHAQLRRLLTATYEIQSSVHARAGDSAEE